MVAVLLLLGDAVIRGSWAVAARGAGPGLLVVWAGWMLLIRPSIRILPDRAVITNLGRVTEVPWPRIVDIRRKLQLVLDLDDGRRVEAWGSPFAPKRPVSKTREQGTDDALISLRAAWMSGASAAVHGEVVRRVDGVALVIGAAVLLAMIVSLVVLQ